METLTKKKKGAEVSIARMEGDQRFLSRVMSMGLIAGTQLKVIQNVKKMPVLVEAMDTVIALNQSEAEKIMVEEAQS